MNIKCNECNAEFELEPKTDDVFDDVEWAYLECPKCGEKYHCWCKNKRIYELEAERKKWQERTVNPNLRKKALRKVEDITKQIAGEMERLKIEVIEKGFNSYDA